MLEGSIQTPLGTAQKKTVAIVGVGLAGIIGIVWWRSRGAGKSADVTVPGEAINPATGYPYGSAEDAAALAEQGGYVTPTTGNPTGGTNTGGGWVNTPGTFVNNAAWTQDVLAQYAAMDVGGDVSQMAAALGKYVTGQPVTAVEKSLISVAVAIDGYPPIAGTNGYPPSINTGNPTPATAPKVLPAPTGVKVAHVTRTSLTFTWNPVPGAVTYYVQYRAARPGSKWRPAPNARTATIPFTIPTTPNTGMYIHVLATNSAGKGGPYSAAAYGKTLR
jgi:hypothetical protein